MPNVRDSRRPSLWVGVLTAWLGLAGWAGSCMAEDPGWPEIFREDFEAGSARWQPGDPQAWRIVLEGGSQRFDQFQQSKVTYPVRAPFNRAVARDLIVGSFQFDVDFRSTARDYPHRSLCLFFGVQDDTHLYYVHFGQRADDHANQIFIVNEAPRVKISRTSTEGTPWDDQWHHARIIRNVDTGEIKVYFDNLEQPIMTAVDKTFLWGQIGIGSFDDTGMFDNVVIRGIRVSRPEQ